MLIGFHVEGHDYLVLRSLTAKLLGQQEDECRIDHVDHSGMGWQQVLEAVPKALKRFYGKATDLAVIGVDNDGEENLLRSGASEDAAHPRHWNHVGLTNPSCRFCRLQALIDATRPALNWNNRPEWPIVIAVPVELIESWLRLFQAVVEPGQGSLHAEREPRSVHKYAFYGRPAATRTDVERLALPLIRRLTSEQLESARKYSQSLDSFASQLARLGPNANLTSAIS